jgi:single-strand DNA-binding protein
MTTTITTEANLTTDPILRFTKTTGQAVCTIRLACSARRKNAEGGYEDTSTVFYEGTAWGALAENLAESLRKGDRLLVHGSTYDEEWTDRDGMTRVKHVIQVTAAGASLRYATAQITRSSRANPSETALRADEAEPVEAGY